MTAEADLLIIGAPVYTADPARPWADAVAVRAGRVAAAGPERDLAELRGPSTRVLRLDGGLVLPGFQDAHVHTAAGGLELAQCDLHEVEPAAYAATVARYAADHPGDPWVLGGGWVMDAFGTGGPHRSALDAVVADRPVLLESTDGHSAWVNGLALELAGITRATPDPPRGRIERDASGEPTGALHEAAKALVGDLAPEPGQAEWEAAIERGQAHLHRLGITAWQDAAVEPDMLAAYRAVAERGRLTGRAVAALRWEVEAGGAQLADLVERRRTGTVGRLRASAVKIFSDGVFENRTAAMLEPYLDADGRPTGNLGIGMLAADELARVVTALDAEAFDVHVHAIGDRAVRDTLDAFQAAAATNGRRDARHQIAHLQFVHPDDRPRFRRLGVVANAQPFWSCLDGYMRELTLPFLEPERAGRQYPWASLRRAGAVLAFGSDWTVSTANPLREIEVAVRRVDPGDPDGEPFLPDERVDLPAALDAFTSGSAYALRLEAETGSVTPGKLADLAVLDRDPFDPAAGPIAGARVLATLVEGEPVHADPSLDLG
ncbi:MAG TPA: amidohydrolase family protein [Actinomycetes bacterium]|nr:amidohydrolase family protein [Actinomycetes bacterium]